MELNFDAILFLLESNCLELMFLIKLTWLLLWTDSICLSSASLALKTTHLKEKSTFKNNIQPSQYLPASAKIHIRWRLFELPSCYPIQHESNLTYKETKKMESESGKGKPNKQNPGEIFSASKIKLNSHFPVQLAEKFKSELLHMGLSNTPNGQMLLSITT